MATAWQGLGSKVILLARGSQLLLRNGAFSSGSSWGADSPTRAWTSALGVSVPRTSAGLYTYSLGPTLDDDTELVSRRVTLCHPARATAHRDHIGWRQWD